MAKTTRKRPTYQTQKHKEQMELAARLSASGLKYLHIAQKLNLHYQTVAKWARSDEFKKMVERFSAQQIEMIDKQMEELMGAAYVTYMEALASKDMRIRLRAAKEIFEIQGKFKQMLELTDSSGTRDYSKNLDNILDTLRSAYERGETAAANGSGPAADSPDSAG